jgi:solute carrier family 39 (zinc transporter), member 9
MGDKSFMLLILSSIMAISSFLAGVLPLSISLSSRQLQITTQLGGGLLIGTALIIIIPEGIGALYETHDSKAGKETIAHSVIGLALILGFVMMYLIDVVPSISSGNIITKDSHIPLSSSASDDITLAEISQVSSHTHATTIGLVIHAFADGIALGASTAQPSTVGLVVFAAIMLHKAPAAFGLTTTLLKQGLSKREARTHLLLFSFAAPLGAFVTWIVIQGLTRHGVAAQQNDGGFWTGVALIFSGGTFL